MCPVFSGTAAVHGKQLRSPFLKGTGAVFVSLHGACQERGDLRAGAGGGGVEATAADAGGDTVLDSPSYRPRVVSVSGDVDKVRRTARRRGLAHGPPQHGDHLGAVDGGVGLRAVGNTLILGPQLRLFVPVGAAGDLFIM